MEKIKLIIGLGNPDPKYQNTYHNVGHLFVDYISNAKLTRIHPPSPKNTGERNTNDAQILKSDIFMNKSGSFVKEILKKEKIKPENLLITHDDSDIELGKFKLSFGRNSAGHKGVQNIINQLKTKNFWRLRIGIRPARNKDKADALVLRKITPARLEVLEKVFREAIVKINF